MNLVQIVADFEGVVDERLCLVADSDEEKFFFKKYIFYSSDWFRVEDINAFKGLSADRIWAGIKGKFLSRSVIVLRVLIAYLIYQILRKYGSSY